MPKLAAFGRLMTRGDGSRDPPPRDAERHSPEKAANAKRVRRVLERRAGSPAKMLADAGEDPRTVVRPVRPAPASWCNPQSICRLLGVQTECVLHPRSTH